MARHRVIAERSGAWWNLEVPDDPLVYSPTKRLEQAGSTAKDALALKYCVPESTIEIDLEVRLGDE